MKLYFKQKIFSWLDSYDVYDESGDIYFRVKGRIAWGHKLAIYDADGNELGTVREKIVDIMPHFDFYMGRTKVGTLKKKITLLKPKFAIDFAGRKWEIDGNWWEWDYFIKEKKAGKIAAISKRIFRLTDSYVIEVKDPDNALGALMVVIAIDAEKCSEEKKEEKNAAKKAKRAAR